MGLTFENIHIFTKKNELPEEIKQKSKMIRLAEDWLTLCPQEGHNFYEGEGHSFYEGSKMARQLSKQIICSVLWVSYFDDDLVTLAVFQEGKRLCNYQVDDNGRVFFEKPKAWKKAFELKEQELLALRYVSKSEETAGGTLGLLTPILGLPFFYAGTFDGKDNIELYKKQTEWIQNWVEQKNVLNRIKNHTCMKLCCELSGICANTYEDWQYRIVRICPPDKKGSFEYNHICCYMIKEETFIPVYDYQYPEELFGKEDKSLVLDYANKDIRVMDINAVGNGDGWKYWDAYIDRLERLISDNGRLKLHPLAKKLEYSNVIETPKGKYQYFCKNINFNPSPTLVKEQLDGLDYKEYRYEDNSQEWFWSHVCSLKLTEKQLVMVTQKICYGGTNKKINDIRFFDKDLNLLRKVEIITYKPKEEIEDDFLYLPERDTIYYKGCSCELSSKKISHSVPQVEGHIFNNFDKRGNILLFCNRSTIILLDQNLHVLSKHRLKGHIYNSYYNESGNICFITVDETVYDWNRPEAKAAVRIYELSYKEKML